MNVDGNDNRQFLLNIVHWLSRLDGPAEGFTPLDITVLHAQRAGRLPGVHRDRFDCMLIAQAQLEDIAILSDDGVFEYGLRGLW
jgi:PIN domain nuclease of toxin-antitoxin system